MAIRPVPKRWWLRGFAAAASLLVVFCLAAQEPVKVQAARRAFNEAFRQEDWNRAIDIGLELVRLAPNRPVDQYNLACAYALGGDADSALHWLGRSAASGFYRLSHLDADTDLDAVRDLPGYESVRESIATNLENRRTDAIRAASSTKPIVVAPDINLENRRRPLIIALHGYGDIASNFAPAWGWVAEEMGAILAVPNGSQPVETGRSWGDVEQADAVLQATLTYVKKRYRVDPDRVVLTGFSQGGFMAMALGTRHPDLFIGVIPVAGGYLPDVDAPPAAGDRAPRYFFMVGARDRVAEEVRRAAADFREAGYEVDLRVVPSTGHAIPRERNRELGRALRFVLDE